MRILIVDNCKRQGAVLLAIASTLSTAGHSVEYFRRTCFNTGFGVDCDAVVVDNWKSANRQLAANFAERGIPVFVVELGWLKRAATTRRIDLDRYYQMSINGLNKPPEAGDLDRLERLGMEMLPKANDPDGPVVILGQVPLDAAHGYTGNELLAIYSAWADELKGLCPVVYRPHPRANKHTLKGVENLDAAQPLKECLSSARCVMTINSTAGIDALNIGIPVSVSDPACCYRQACTGDVVTPKFMAKARTHVFSRLAAGQFSGFELTDGTVAEHIVQKI